MTEKPFTRQQPQDPGPKPGFFTPALITKKPFTREQKPFTREQKPFTREYITNFLFKISIITLLIL